MHDGSVAIDPEPAWPRILDAFLDDSHLALIKRPQKGLPQGHRCLVVVKANICIEDDIGWSLDSTSSCAKS